MILPTRFVLPNFNSHVRFLALASGKRNRSVVFLFLCVHCLCSYLYAEIVSWRCQVEEMRLKESMYLEVWKYLKKNTVKLMEKNKSSCSSRPCCPGRGLGELCYQYHRHHPTAPACSETALSGTVGEKTLHPTGLEHITSQPRDRSSAVWRRRAPTWPASPGRRPAPAAGPSWCRSPPRRRARRSAGRRCPPGDTCPGTWTQHVSAATRGHTWPHLERR